MKLPNGYGSIHKLSGKRRKPWRVRVTIDFDDNGKQLYKVIGYTKSYQEGLQLLSDYHKNPMLFMHNQLKFKDIFNMWWNQKEKTINENTKRSHTSAYNNSKELHEFYFSDIRLVDLQNEVDKQSDKYSAKKKMKTLYNQMYDFAIANDIVIKKYSTYINLGNKPDKEPIHKAFTDKEKEILWNNINKIPYVDLILVYNYTGFRPSELLDIKQETGVNLEEKYLKGGAKTDAGKNRIIPIHPRIMPIILKWYKKGGKYLITNKNGDKMSYDNWKQIFISIMKKINGIDGSHLPHDSRHTFSTDLDNLGANEIVLQKLMGHAGKNITQKVYIHKDIEELRKTIEMLP